ncbi:MAG: hypothetical protein M3R00_04630 [Pseudomonadota bacterium]|nr:hypothetical protein [Pseudomonadota bacterium]
MMFWIIITIVCIAVTAFLLGSLWRTRAALVLLSVPIAAVLFYQQWGAYPDVRHATLIKQRLGEVKQQIAHDGSRRTLIKQFEEHLKIKPDSAKGWYLLGKLYLSEGQKTEAVNALTKANTLNAKDPETMLALAEALFWRNQQKLDGTARTLLQRVIAKEPTAVGAYHLLAIDAYNRGDFKIAVVYWEKVLPLYPQGSEEVKKILDLIARAQRAQA